MNAFHDVNVSTKLCWWSWWLFMKADRERLGRRTSYTNVLPGTVNDYIVLRAPCCPHLGFWLWVSCDNLHFDWYWPRLDAVLVLPSRPSAEIDLSFIQHFSPLLTFQQLQKYCKMQQSFDTMNLKMRVEEQQNKAFSPLTFILFVSFSLFPALPRSIKKSRGSKNQFSNFFISCLRLLKPSLLSTSWKNSTILHLIGLRGSGINSNSEYRQHKQTGRHNLNTELCFVDVITRNIYKLKCRNIHRSAFLRFISVACNNNPIDSVTKIDWTVIQRKIKPEKSYISLLSRTESTFSFESSKSL